MSDRMTVSKLDEKVEEEINDLRSEIEVLKSRYYQVNDSMDQVLNKVKDVEENKLDRQDLLDIIINQSKYNQDNVVKKATIHSSIKQVLDSVHDNGMSMSEWQSQEILRLVNDLIAI